MHVPSRVIRPHAEVVATAALPTRFGEFTTHVFRGGDAGDGQTHEHVALVMGDLAGEYDVPVRVHSECMTSEVFGSLKCDCKEQLDYAMVEVARRGAGAVLYLRQEGRGIGFEQQDSGVCPAIAGARHRRRQPPPRPPRRRAALRGRARHARVSGRSKRSSHDEQPGQDRRPEGAWSGGDRAHAGRRRAESALGRLPRSQNASGWRTICLRGRFARSAATPNRFAARSTGDAR